MSRDLVLPTVVIPAEEASLLVTVQYVDRTISQPNGKNPERLGPATVTRQSLTQVSRPQN